jgi:hypothetical protein
VVSPMKILKKSIFFSFLIGGGSLSKILSKLKIEKIYFLSSYWLKNRTLCDFV